MHSVFITALICVFHVNFNLSKAAFTNVAYSKPVTLSSVYSGHHGYFPGPNAVNGLLSDFVHTSTEKSPWLRIDLEANFQIHEIEMFARSGCCVYFYTPNEDLSRSQII
uniref:F5/8 type C domain-containing protein n=1 Tax=Magallana gigas TaxID=29159 RepID=A0A8W8M1W7_MAGGI